MLFSLALHMQKQVMTSFFNQSSDSLYKQLQNETLVHKRHVTYSKNSLLCFTTITFFSLNVSQSVFCRVSNDTNNTPAMPPFIFAYMQRPIALEHLTLLEAAHCWSFSPNRKKIHGNETCVTKLSESIHISLPFLPLILHLLNRFVGVNFFYTNLFGPSLTI